MDDIDTDGISHILTLRYDPRAKSHLPHIGWRDIADDAQDIQHTVEQKTKAGIADFIGSRKPKSISLALSGGVDSNLALILIREMYPDMKIRCISFGFSHDDPDIDGASETARKYDADFESFVLDNFFSNLPRQIHTIKEPKMNYYWYFVAEKAKRHSDILVTGDGGDELFGGYVFRYKKYQDAFKPDFGWRERVLLYLKCHNRDWVDDQEEMFGTAAKFTWDAIHQTLRPFFDNPLDPLKQVFLADYNGKLMHDWTPSHDKIYSHFDMCGFSPFLNDDLLRYSFTVPTRYKYDKDTGIGKIILRRILKDRGHTISESKRGFTPNYYTFWRNHGKKNVQRFLLGESHIVRECLISAEWIKNAIHIVEQNGDIRYMNRLLQVVSFEIWYRLFVSRDMDASFTL